MQKQALQEEESQLNGDKLKLAAEKKELRLKTEPDKAQTRNYILKLKLPLFKQKPWIIQIKRKCL